MLSEEIYIELFLSKPSESILLLIDNKELAIDLLNSSPSSSSKALFFWKRDRRSYKIIHILNMLLLERNSVFYRVYDEVRDKTSLRDHIAHLAAYYGRIGELEYVINDGVTRWSHIVEGAVKGGQREIVLFLLNKKWTTFSVDNLNKLALIAMEYGRNEIVCDMIMKGANNYNDIAVSAALVGSLIMMKSMYGYGATNTDSQLYNAAKGNCEECIEYLSDRSVMMIACGAASGGHIELVETGYNDWSFLLGLASAGGQKEMVDYLIRRSGDGFIRWDILIRHAELGGHKELVKYIECKVNTFLSFNEMNSCKKAKLNDK